MPGAHTHAKRTKGTLHSLTVKSLGSDNHQLRSWFSTAHEIEGSHNIPWDEKWGKGEKRETKGDSKANKGGKEKGEKSPMKQPNTSQQETLKME